MGSILSKFLLELLTFAGGFLLGVAYMCLFFISKESTQNIDSQNTTE